MFKAAAGSCPLPPCPAESEAHLLVGFERGGPPGQAHALTASAGSCSPVATAEEGCRAKAVRCDGLFPLGVSSRGTCLTVFKVHLTLELPPAFPQTRSPPVHLPPVPSSICTVRHHRPRGEAPASEPGNVKLAPATCGANGPSRVQLQEPFL